MGANGNKIHLGVGARFYKWKILSEAPSGPNNQVRYLCQCDCGIVKSIASRELRIGLTKQCQACYYLENANRRNAQSFVGVIHNSYLYRLKTGARNRDIPVDLSMEDLNNKWKEQQGLCALTGLVLTLRKNGRDWTSTASVDRMNSKDGYTKANIQWVHQDVNLMKNSFPEDRFIEICCLVADYRNH